MSNDDPSWAADDDRRAPLVWIADDSPLEAQIVRRSLGDRYEVEVFSDGSSLLERLAQSRRQPDILLLDWVMPGISGEEVCRFLRAQPDTADLSILLVTASRVEVDDVVAGLAAGADDYVAKPFAPEELRARLEAVLRGKQLREAAQTQTRRLELIAHVARRLAAAGPAVQSVIDSLAETLAETLGDGCLIGTRLEDAQGGAGDHREAAYLSICHKDSALCALLREMLARDAGPECDWGQLGEMVLATDTHRVLRFEGVEALRAFAPPRWHPYLEQWGVQELVLAPLRDRTCSRGAVILWRGADRAPFTRGDRALLDTCLEYGSLTFQNAQLYDAERRARARVANERAQLEAMVDQLPVGVIIANQEGRVTLFNRASSEIIGDTMDRGVSVSQLQLLGQYVRPAEEPTGPAGFSGSEQMPLGRALAGGVVRGEEIVVHRPDGQVRTIRASAGPIVGSGGARLGAVATFEDVSVEKAAAMERQRNAHFQEQFMGILGHDLRNPITAISMTAALLTRRLGPREAQALGRITASAERMRRMVDQLLDLAMARLGGGIAIVLRSVELGALTRGVIEELQVAYPQCALVVRIDPDIRGEWDPDRLEQAISNIAANAVQHGRQGCPVTISVRRVDEEGIVEVHNENEAGEEIPAELLPVLFDPFRRGRSEQGRSQGLGLGLFITREIVLGHGGRIEVESSREAGTRFRISLPLQRPAPSIV